MEIIIEDPFGILMSQQWTVVPKPDWFERAWADDPDQSWVVVSSDKVDDYDPEFDTVLITFDVDTDLYSMWEGPEYEEPVGEWMPGYVTKVEA